MNRRIASAALLITLIGALSLTWPAPAAHADWRSLTELLPEYVGRVDYKISPDSQTVAFVADKDTDDVDELFAVSITGGEPIKLNPPLVANGDVLPFRFTFTPDSQYLIYLADQEVDNRVEMYRVPVGGGESAKMNPALVVGGNITNLKLDAKNQRVIYEADQETNDVVELWSMPLGGGQSIRLNGPMTPGGNIGLFEIDPLSNRVVYSADQDTNGKYELYSVPVAGGTFTKLNPPITLGGGGDSGIYSEWFINPIIPVVVFMARETGSNARNLLMIPTAGGVTPTQLNFNLLATQRILGFRVSPAGDRVVYNVGTRSGNTNAFKGNLYSVLIDGGGAADLTEPAEPLYGVDGYNFSFTPDGKRVVYAYQKNATAPARLESTTVATAVRATLYAPGASDSPLGLYRLSADSQWVVYQDQDDGLYSIPSGGGNAVRHGTARHEQITSDSSRLIYRRITGDNQHTDLFSAQIFGGDERDLSGLKGAGYVGDVQISPDGKQIVFVVQIDSRYELRVSDGRAAQPPTTPTPTLPPGVTPTTQPAPNGRRVHLPLTVR
jgi:Tol biopolymer transport system component